MKNELRGRIIITVKDLAILSGWGPPKCREFIRTAKEELGLNKDDVFTNLPFKCQAESSGRRTAAKNQLT